MSDSSEVKYVTVTSPSQIKPPKPRHRVKVTMDEWETTGTDGEVPVLWATQLSALERSQFRASLEKYDETHGIWFTSGENEQVHFLAFCLRDHAGHRIWTDLAEARKQLGEFPYEDILKLMDACNQAQTRPRAEGNGGRSETTQPDKSSGTLPSDTADTPTQTSS